MSGGHFDYMQDYISEIADKIQWEIDNNTNKPDDWHDEWGEYKRYSDKVIEQFEAGIEFLRIAEVYARRFDWLISDDDREESFLQHLKEDLEKVIRKQ